jgi:hypothetical protein
MMLRDNHEFYVVQILGMSYPECCVEYVVRGTSNSFSFPFRRCYLNNIGPTSESMLNSRLVIVSSLASFFFIKFLHSAKQNP